MRRIQWKSHILARDFGNLDVNKSGVAERSIA